MAQKKSIPLLPIVAMVAVLEVAFLLGIRPPADQFRSRPDAKAAPDGIGAAPPQPCPNG